MSGGVHHEREKYELQTLGGVHTSESGVRVGPEGKAVTTLTQRLSLMRSRGRRAASTARLKGLHSCNNVIVYASNNL